MLLDISLYNKVHSTESQVFLFIIMDGSIMIYPGILDFTIRKNPGIIGKIQELLGKIQEY